MEGRIHGGRRSGIQKAKYPDRSIKKFDNGVLSSSDAGKRKDISNASNLTQRGGSNFNLTKGDEVDQRIS